MYRVEFRKDDKNRHDIVDRYGNVIFTCFVGGIAFKIADLLNKDEEMKQEYIKREINRQKQGRWLLDHCDSYGYSYYHCSECNCHTRTKDEITKVFPSCPICYARMTAEKEKENEI